MQAETLLGYLKELRHFLDREIGWRAAAEGEARDMAGGQSLPRVFCLPAQCCKIAVFQTLIGIDRGEEIAEATAHFTEWYMNIESKSVASLAGPEPGQG